MLHIHAEPGTAMAAVSADPAYARLMGGDVLDHDMFGTAVLASVIATAAAAGAQWIDFEADSAGAVHDRMADANNMVLRRTVVQVARDLPAAAPPDDVSLRTFRPGVDDDEWLVLNNRIFHWHPDQSGWTHATLAERIAEDWFDADGFLIHETDGVMDGFCWTKVHDHDRPPVGEIYVIGVDPDTQGHGLGRALVTHGLDHLHRTGLRSAMLWVESDNTPALRLYDDLGFETQARHCWWRRSFS